MSHTLPLDPESLHSHPYEMTVDVLPLFSQFSTSTAVRIVELTYSCQAVDHLVGVADCRLEYVRCLTTTVRHFPGFEVLVEESLRERIGYKCC